MNFSYNFYFSSFSFFSIFLTSCCAVQEILFNKIFSLTPITKITSVVPKSIKHQSLDYEYSTLVFICKRLTPLKSNQVIYKKSHFKRMNVYDSYMRNMSYVKSFQLTKQFEHTPLQSYIIFHGLVEHFRDN